MSRRGRSGTGPRRPPKAGGVRHPVGVLWERLEVEGVTSLGALDVRFPAGLGTLIRPNEWGKSRVVRALVAALFGAPLDEDAGRGEGEAPAGSLRLRFVGVDGVRYRLARDLASGEARLERLEGAGDPEDDGAWIAVDVADDATVEDALHAAIGLADRDTFVQSFCVTQPLPRAERVGSEVQRLLMGAGRGGVERALAELEDELAWRTREAPAWDADGGGDDGALERAEARLATLESELKAGREATDGVQEAARALAEAEARRERHREEAARIELEADRLRAYLTRRRTLEQRLEAERSAAQTLARAEALQAEAARAAARVAEVWPELAEAPDDGEAHLASLMAAERSIAEISTTLANAERALEVARRAASERGRELERHAAHAPIDDDEGLTVDAVRELRAGAEQAAADWRAYLRREEAVAEARDGLRPYALLAMAPEQDRALLRRYDYEAETRVRAAEGLEAAVREARAERRRLLVPDPSLPNDLEAEALRAALASPQRWRRSGVTRLGAGALAGAGALWLGMQAVGVALAAGVAGLVGLGVAALVRPVPIGGPRLQRFRGRSRAELQELLGHYETWRAQPVPTRRDVARLEGEMGAAREQLRAFQRRMQPYQEAFPEPGTAYDAFRDAQRTLQQREEVHRELSIRTFGVAPEDVKARSPLDMPAPWPQLAAFAEARGGRAHGLAELGTFLTRLEPSAWDDVLAAAQGRDDARRGHRAERERLRREVAVADTVLEEREATVTALRAELHAAEASRDADSAPLEALLEATDGDAAELLRRWRERDQALQEAERSFDALASLLDTADCESVDALRERFRHLEAEVREEREAVDALAEAQPDLPRAASAFDRARLLDRLESLEERMALERSAREAAEAEVYERTRELAARQAKPVVHLAKATAERAELLARRDALRAEIAALTLAHEELRAAVRDFQGSYRERLERLASDHFAALTDRDARRVSLLDDFAVRVIEPDGEERAPQQLSRGAQDQLALALRLAIADHVADDVRLPLVLDDPVLHFDAERLELLRGSLERVARQRQVVLLSHDAAFAAWGESVTVD